MCNIQNWQMFRLKWHPLEVVDCGSETQLQVDDNFKLKPEEG